MLTLRKFNKYPAVLTVIPLALGILLGSTLSFPSIFKNYLWFIIVQSVLVMLAIMCYSRFSGKNSIYYAAYFILTIIFGINSFQYNYSSRNEKNIESYLSEYNRRNVKLFGKIIEQPDIRDDRIKLIISADSISTSGTVTVCGGNVIASVYKNRYSDPLPGEIKYGDAVCLTGKLGHLPIQHNPGEFDYGKYLKLHGIDASFTTYGYSNVNIAAPASFGLYYREVIYPVKNYSIMVIDSLIGSDEGEFMKGLVLGERSNISSEIKENFVKAGVSHIIAVSGLNVVYVMIIINGLLLVFPFKRWIKTVIVILFLLFYMNLTGNTPSIIRATIMAIIYLVSQMIERKPVSYNIVAFSALVILLIDPAQLFDAGFILSYSAILSIMIFYRPLNAFLLRSKWYSSLDPGNKLHKSVRMSIQLVLGTLAAQIGTLPIVAIMFNRISIISLLTNLVAIPVSNAALALGFIVIISSTFSVWLAGIFANSAFILLSFLLSFIDYFANFDFSFVEMHRVDAVSLLFYYAVIIMLFLVSKRNIKFAIALVVLFCANYFLYRSIIEQEDKVKITYLDVGRSEACFITFPEKGNVLINCAGSSEKYNSAQRNVIPYMKMQGADNLDYIILTSLDKDEFRNLFYMLRDFPVKKVLVPVFYKPLFEDEHFSKFFSDKNIAYITGSTKINGKNSRIYIYYDNRIVPARSMLVRFDYGASSFVFGDSKDVREDEIYSNVFTENDPVDVLKVPFAGSFNLSSPEFIVKADPRYSVISSSNNRRRIQSEIFSRTLEMSGIRVFKTEDRGAVIFETDGKDCFPAEWQ